MLTFILKSDSMNRGSAFRPPAPQRFNQLTHRDLDLFSFFQCSLPELDNPLSMKIRSIVSGLLEKRPNSMKVSSERAGGNI